MEILQNRVKADDGKGGFPGPENIDGKKGDLPHMVEMGVRNEDALELGLLLDGQGRGTAPRIHQKAFVEEK